MDLNTFQSLQVFNFLVFVAKKGFAFDFLRVTHYRNAI